MLTRNGLSIHVVLKIKKHVNYLFEKRDDFLNYFWEVENNTGKGLPYKGIKMRVYNSDNHYKWK